jgi:uncharacterized protein YdaU (DUF1376 family)
MSKAPFWPVATDALIADTMHLSTEEFGAYMRLMIAQWRSNGNPLPNDEDRLARMAGLSGRAWKRVRSVIADFFTISDAGWSQKRVEKDFVEIIGKIEKNRLNGSNGGKAKALKYNNEGLANATNSPDVSPQQNTSETPTNQNQNQNQNQKEKEPPSLRSGGTPANEPEIPDSSPPKPKTKTARGTRWPSEAVVPDDWLQEAGMKRAERGLPAIDLRFEAERFANYWAARAGPGAVKVDWRRTWLNWITDDSKGRNGNANGCSGNGQKPIRGHQAFLAGGILALAESEENSRQCERHEDSSKPGIGDIPLAVLGPR